MNDKGIAKAIPEEERRIDEAAAIPCGEFLSRTVQSRRTHITSPTEFCKYCTPPFLLSSDSKISPVIPNPLESLETKHPIAYKWIKFFVHLDHEDIPQIWLERWPFLNKSHPSARGIFNTLKRHNIIKLQALTFSYEKGLKAKIAKKSSDHWNLCHLEVLSFLSNEMRFSPSTELNALALMVNALKVVQEPFIGKISDTDFIRMGNFYITYARFFFYFIRVKSKIQNDAFFNALRQLAQGLAIEGLEILKNHNADSKALFKANFCLLAINTEKKSYLIDIKRAIKYGEKALFHLKEIDFPLGKQINLHKDLAKLYERDSNFKNVLIHYQFAFRLSCIPRCYDRPRLKILIQNLTRTLRHVFDPALRITIKETLLPYCKEIFDAKSPLTKDFMESEPNTCLIQ